MTLLKTGDVVDDPRLDRVPSGHTTHLDRFPLTADTIPAKPTPMVIGVNWYSNFDKPSVIKVKGIARAAIGVETDLGRVRGGHATCLRPWSIEDAIGWYRYYDQLKEGRCVEFASLRMLTLMNRVRYDITSRWHYWEMQRLDYWPGGSYPGASPVYAGTSVDAGMQVLHRMGAIPARHRGAPIDPAQAPALVAPQHGIAAYRWARTWDDVRAVLGVPDYLPGVPLLNSWGRGYPKEVLLMDAAGERLLRERGEFAVVTDR